MTPQSAKKSILNVLGKILGKRILIIGDLMLDEYVFGDTNRISPEAPVVVVEVQKKIQKAGGAANVAMNVASLGGVALLGGIVGRDRQASQLRRELTKQDIDIRGVLTDRSRPTTTKTRILSRNQNLVRVDSEIRKPINSELEKKILIWMKKNINKADGCIITDYNKGVVTRRVASTLIDLARRAHKPVVVDPKGTDYSKYVGATVVTPNLHEAQSLTSQSVNHQSDLVKIGKKLSRLLKGSSLLITQGENGMTLFEPQTQPYHITAAKRSIFDVTGAGDTVVSTLALFLAGGAKLNQAAYCSNKAAGIVVSKIGTDTVSYDELRCEINL